MSISLTLLEKSEILLKKKETLNNVSAYINKHLNSFNYNFYDSSKKDFIEPKSFNGILSDLGLSEDT